MQKKSNGPKVLLFDIETAPILGYVWGLFDQNIGLNQVHSDWHLLSWSAKWHKGSNGKVYGPHNKIMYMDQRKAKNVEDDKELLKGIWKLLDESDIVITQNGKKFDSKKLNARFILNGFKPPSSYKHIDTLQIARSKFGFTSNKLEYMTKALCSKYKKLSHKKFSGFELWKECLAGNIKAWKEMEAYNKVDVLSLEELYIKLQPWDSSFNPDLYNDNEVKTCACGSKELNKNGYAYTSKGKFQRYTCASCGAEVKSGSNLFSKEKRDSLNMKVK